MNAAVARLRAEPGDLKDEDVTRLSLLKGRHINSRAAACSTSG